jgi:cytochrome c biogenesis protein CcmG/thiol:disulfide interchange protein DsbE
MEITTKNIHNRNADAENPSEENRLAAQESGAPGVKQRSRKRNIVVFSIVTVINIGLLVLLWTQLLTPKTTSATHSPDDTAISAGDVSSPLIGKTAPDFTLSVINGTQQGQKISLSDFKGKPVIVNFWASWCEPCQQETPLLQQQWVNSLRAKGVVLIGIDGGEPSSDGVKFLQKYGVTYTNVADSVGIGSSVGDTFGITARPETYFIDPDGKVVARWIGGLSVDGLQQELAKIAKP